MTINRTMRASDQDREHVVEILRTSYSEGRLTLEEFDERVATAYTGKTWGDLLALTSDLPVQVRLGADQALAAPGDRRVSPGRPGLPLRLLPLAPLLLGLLLISSIGFGYGQHHHHYVPFIPVWPLLLIALLFLRRRGTHRGGRYR